MQYDEMPDHELNGKSIQDAVFFKQLSKLRAFAGGGLKTAMTENEDVIRLAYRDELIQHDVLNSLPQFGLELVDKDYPYEVRLTHGNS